MSPLQIGLLVIAVIAVAAVYLYNLFEERRVQRRMDGAFQNSEDVLLTPRPAKEEKKEPSLAVPIDDREIVVSLSDAARPTAAENPPIEPPPEVETIEVPPLPDEPALASPPSQRPRLSSGAVEIRPDVLIESLVCFSFDEPVQARDFWAACPEELRSLPTWYGRGEGEWEALGPDVDLTCREVTAGLLLADRQGAVSRALLRNFLDGMSELARRSGATLMLPEINAEVARADALDQACSVVDVQIGLTLLRRDAAMLPGTRLRGVAEAAGFRLNERGGFDYVHEESGRLMFELVDVGGRPLTADGLKTLQMTGITLVLDLPRISEPLKAFDQMKAIARRLGVTLEANLVDDARRPLADSALNAIRTQLQQACAAMRDMDVEPGSLRALRLFS